MSARPLLFVLLLATPALAGCNPLDLACPEGYWRPMAGEDCEPVPRLDAGAADQDAGLDAGATEDAGPADRDGGPDAGTAPADGGPDAGADDAGHADGGPADAAAADGGAVTDGG
jgi:hypothetical protein